MQRLLVPAPVDVANDFFKRLGDLLNGLLPSLDLGLKRRIVLA